MAQSHLYPSCVFIVLCYLLYVDSSSESANCTRKGVTEGAAYLALSDISARWETLALLLNIPRGMRGNIEMDCHDNDCKYRRTIETWYNGRPNASWDELVFVLEQMGENKLANQVAKEYLCQVLKVTMYRLAGRPVRTVKLIKQTKG